MTVTTAEAGTLGLNKITIRNLHKVARTLGGKKQDRLTSHQYEVYSLPGTDCTLHIPARTFRGPNSIIGKGQVATITRSLLDAGIPQQFIIHAFDMHKAVWHQPPDRAPHIQKLLRNERGLIKRGEWGTLNLLAARNAPAEEGPPMPEPKPDRKYVDGFTYMRDVTTLNLPEGYDPKVAGNITRNIAATLASGYAHPWRELREGEHVIRVHPKGAKGARYCFTEHAINTLAQEARERYDVQVPHYRKPDDEGEPEDAREEEQITYGAHEHDDGLHDPIHRDPPPRTHPDGRLAREPIEPDLEPIPIGRALAALIRRFGVDLTMNYASRVDLEAFIMDLEIATRDWD